MIHRPIARPARPLIGLSGRRKRGADIAGLPASLAHVDVDVYISAYAQAITAAGGLPVHLPQHVDPAEYAGRLDGLLLSGGADVDPARYGAEPATDLYPPEPARDAAELGLIDVALTDGIPVLGICRGLQLLNVWAGGTLHQHVPEHARYDIPPSERVDALTVEPGSRLHELYGSQLDVNSLHHQTVDRVADGWVVTARSADGTIEALEWPDHDIIAVQWHPELLPGAASDPLFAWLVERAGAQVGARS
jgi:putative glutamine amidotransferase